VLAEEHASKVWPRYPAAVSPGGKIRSEVYRTHLRTYLEALLRNVDEWARAEQSPPPGIEHKMPLP
jgi:hypothetical protein